MTDSSAEEFTDKPYDAVLKLLEALREEEARQREKIDSALPANRVSATNLSHYLALRRQDIRHLQLELGGLGLSSLGRCEGHVRDTLLRLHAWLSSERGDLPQTGPDKPLDRARADKILHENTQALFGARPPDRHVYIMVTAPSDVAATADWADAVLQAGADLLRINGAHESPREWASTASTFKSRAAALGRTVRIFVDLPGPKLRTKIRQLDVPVLRFRRHKDRLGRTTAPTSVLLVAKYEGGEQIPVSARWLTELKDGDKLRLTDAGGRKRTLVVRGSGDGGVVAECNHSLYITSGLRLEWRRGEDVMGEGHVGALPGQPKVFRVSIGDGFLLNESGQSDDPSMRVLAFPEPRLLEQVSPGERVIFDDGRIIAVVEELRSDGVLCRVQRARKSPIRLRSGKGIAFPDSKFSLEMVGRRDEVALEFALKHADGLAVSFINSPQDVALVGERVKRAGKPGFGMILKLETRGAMRNLGAILFEALKYDAVGLMIARGDLAVELSFERLAEMQEELLWFGEACHLPVIWATQVLDSVARTGLPTRAEITDAAMSMRAECVMLNRGPHIDIATRMLADIIRKMEAHQYKKLSLDRPLSVAGTGTMLEPQ